MDSNLSKFLNNRNNQLSGQLYKYTNVVKGWQYRWFNTDAENALLTYFLISDEKDENNSNQRVRGQVSLRGAVISPSDEDSRTFTVNCASGDILKLRASDARERQEWVDGLRAIVESHSQQMALPPRENFAAYNALITARQQLQQTELCNSELCKMIENSPPPLNHNDPDLLLLKALSAANTHCLMQALSYLQRHQDVEIDSY